MWNAQSHQIWQKSRPVAFNLASDINRSSQAICSSNQGNFSASSGNTSCQPGGIRRGAGSGSVCKEAGASDSPALRPRTRHGFEILSDGEDGLRGVVGTTWFGKQCQHRLDWFHVARRIARIEKEFLYLPYGDDFQERLAAHWANLNSMKWMLWNDGVDMAEFGMTRVRIGLFQHAMAHPEANSERFESIEAKLDELRSHLYANRESVTGAPFFECA
jgi:hypothetical protein